MASQHVASVSTTDEAMTNFLVAVAKLWLSYLVQYEGKTMTS